ncbi:hypothetical protein LSH36_208g02057 [Paralvinella palmiformis]|uniref:Mab-21-like HhH/H2TH-like domain-containing protein n=1 Tax=Paralvinella palmiformis TaxID=53620 RepID=A0AAD9N4B5_9ANNE|nr:hypothetical protein LSH36_208g02057 [Paralvinella palmiformis]
MSSNRRQQQSNSAVGVAVAVGAAVGVGLGTLIWYAGKKLSQSLLEAGSSSEPSCSRSLDELHREAAAKRKKDSKLVQHLNKYYEDRVEIPDLAVVCQIVQDMRMELIDFFKTYYPDLLLSDVLCQSDDLEGLHARKIDDLDLFVVIKLDEHEWQLQKSLIDPRHYDIKRMASDCDSSLSLIDSCLVDDMLSPMKFIDFMTKDFCHKFIVPIDSYQVVPVTVGSSVALNICNDGKSVRFNLIPAIRLGNVLVTPDSSAARQNVWQESFFEKEMQKLYKLNPKRCCHLRCIQIMKAVACDHQTEFGFLNPYIYKTVVLQMLDDDPNECQWLHDDLPARFTAVLKMLVFYLMGRNAPHYFLPDLNLLEGVSAESCDVLVDLIQTCINEEKMSVLLG